MREASGGKKWKIKTKLQVSMSLFDFIVYPQYSRNVRVLISSSVARKGNRTLSNHLHLCINLLQQITHNLIKQLILI